MAKRRSYNLRLPCCRQRGMLCRAAADPHISKLFFLEEIKFRMCFAPCAVSGSRSSFILQGLFFGLRDTFHSHSHFNWFTPQRRQAALRLKIQLKHHLDVSVDKKRKCPVLVSTAFQFSNLLRNQSSPAFLIQTSFLLSGIAEISKAAQL